MGWHYQAILTTVRDVTGNPYQVLQVHEVYPGTCEDPEEDGFGYTADGMKPDVFYGEMDGELDIEKMRTQLIEILEMMLKDVKKYPALDKRDDD